MSKKSIIRIQKDSAGHFWVKKGRVSQLTRDYPEAKALAREWQAAAGGFEKAIIYDHVGDRKP